MPKSHCYNKDALDRIVGTPTNPKPDGTVRDPVMRRQYITQRWVDEHGVTPGCPRCEGRGTMSHSEACRKRFESIEKKRLDTQLEEEAASIPEPPPETVTEMDVEQPQVQPMMGWSFEFFWTCGICSGGGTGGKSQFRMRCGWKSLNRLAARDLWR